MGTMAIPDQTGHTAIEWRTDDHESCQRAEHVFAELLDQRLVPFARQPSSDDFSLTRAFDPQIDEIMWVRPLQGG